MESPQRVPDPPPTGGRYNWFYMAFKPAPRDAVAVVRYTSGRTLLLEVYSDSKLLSTTANLAMDLRKKNGHLH